MSDIFLSNTKTNQKEKFYPLKKGHVSMYHCGPTVYSRAHIGNLRAFVFADVLKKVFLLNKYKVKQVINITDVGHLTSDQDTGEDKVEKASKQSGQTAKQITDKFTRIFIDDLRALNIDIKGTKFPKATDHIKEQIHLIQILEKKGYTYKISDGVYFDTTKMNNYGILGGIHEQILKNQTSNTQSRIGLNEEKKNSHDFALWKFSPKGEKRQQEWDSPWGVGFPGWHIECSAMSMKYLGETFDIHTGGTDHVSVHHNNEIAQSESATGKEFVKYWMHENFINVNDEKISKSLGNDIYIDDFEKMKIKSPLSYRYLLLTAHYKTLLNFSEESIRGADRALKNLYKLINEIRSDKVVLARTDQKFDLKLKYQKYKDDILTALNDDLNTPKALSILWTTLQDKDLRKKDKINIIKYVDKVFSLELIKNFKKVEGSSHNIPFEIMEIVKEREIARKNKNFAKSDELRGVLYEKGYVIKDSENGPKIEQI